MAENTIEHHGSKDIDLDDIGQGLSDLLWGKQEITEQDLLTEEQQGLLDSLVSQGQESVDDLFSSLRGTINDPQSAYSGLDNFDQVFEDMYGDPLTSRYEKNLADIANTNELFSGGNVSNQFRALNQYNQNLASARSQMMMQERAKEQQSRENSLNRQLQAQQLMANLTTQPLGVRTTENIVSNSGGLLSALANVGQAAGGVGTAIGQFLD